MRHPVTTAWAPTASRRPGCRVTSSPSVTPATCWVRKEAYLKGTGAGLGDGLDGVYVGSGSASPELGGWTLVDLAMPSGYTAALAARTVMAVDARWLFGRDVRGS